MPVQELTAEQLRRVCDQSQFDFETTAELEPIQTIIGQPRGVRAIEFGIGIRSEGYNVYVIGETGTGRTAAIERFLQARAADQAVPDDWVYVHNFSIPHQPHAIALPAGKGAQFKAEMENLVQSLKKDLPEALGTDAYVEAAENIRHLYQEERDRLLEGLRGKAKADEMAIVSTPSGFVIMPVRSGKAMSPDDYHQLPVDEQEALEKKRQSWGDELEEVLHKVRELDDEAREQMNTLNKEVASSAIQHHFDKLRQAYREHEEVGPYISAVYADVLDHIEDFSEAAHSGSDDEPEVDLRRYQVNLLVDNGRLEKGAPVVVELNPRYSDLLGRIEYEIQYGATLAHFTDIKAGSLHRANGGYLVINVRDILPHPDSWSALKRAIKEGKIKIQAPDRADGNQVLAKSLDPEPIDLNVKIILLGNADTYYQLYNRQEDFGQLFKVKAEFDSVMPRNLENEQAYAAFVAGRCQEEGLRHFDRSSVAKLIEFSSRLCGYQDKLSTRFGIIADVIREANFWTGLHGRSVVTAADVEEALRERIQRSNLDEERMLEYITDGTIFVETKGSIVGQVNGLSVIDVGDYAYGHPGRITARTFQGERGIINIDREVDLTGPIHHKGLLSLIGYLGGMYAQEQPLSISASVTFEQNYGNIEGDSASSAELYAILSSLGNLPLTQSIAVTGSVNQRGEILPIGGVVEKIEGFFALCKARGLTGKEGVIIPASNLPNLMLNDEVIEAVCQGDFHLWAVQTIEEGMSILAEVEAAEVGEDGEFPEGTLHHKVMEGIRRLSKNGDDHDDGEDEEEDGDTADSAAA